MEWKKVEEIYFMYILMSYVTSVWWANFGGKIPVGKFWRENLAELTFSLKSLFSPLKNIFFVTPSFTFTHE